MQHHVAARLAIPKGWCAHAHEAVQGLAQMYRLDILLALPSRHAALQLFSGERNCMMAWVLRLTFAANLNCHGVGRHALRMIQLVLCLQPICFQQGMP